MSDKTQNTRVGYRSPPEGTRFKKGVSGNPSGRPKKVASFQADLADELQQLITITENGQTVRITKQRALIKTLVVAAIKNDGRAVSALFAFVRYFGVGAERQSAEEIDINDLDFLENYVAQQRAKQNQSPGTAANTNSKQENEN